LQSKPESKIRQPNLKVFDIVFNIAYNINMEMPSIVLDTNIIISAQRSQRGASAKLLSLIGTGCFEIHLTVALMLEYEDVLHRQRNDLKLTRKDVADLIDALCALSHHHKIYFRWRPQLRDVGDELVLELAVAARCSHIVTYNQKDFAGAEEFGLKVVTPKELLQEIGELK
jgi:putative PIN family toxin of toxin-antitoxin system